MELRQMEYFCTVVNCGSISRAAKAMHITQPSMSAAIKKIETELQVRLISYEHGKLQLTESGRIFYNRCRSLLADMEDIKTEVQMQANHSHLLIHTGTSLDGILEKPMAEFLSLHPECRFVSFVMSKENLEFHLLHGHMDFALSTEGFSSKQIEWEPVYTDPYVALMRPDHSLAQNKYITKQDLEKENLLCYEPTFPMPVKIDEALEKWGLRLDLFSDAFLLSNEIGLCLRVLKQVGGVCILSQSNSRRCIGYAGAPHSDLKEVPLYPPIQGMTMGLAKRKDHIFSAAAAECYHFLKDYAYVSN